MNFLLTIVQLTVSVSAATICSLYINIATSKRVVVSFDNNKKVVLEDRGTQGTDFSFELGHSSKFIARRNINFQSNSFKIYNKNETTIIAWSDLNNLSITVETVDKVKVFRLDFHLEKDMEYTACYYLHSDLHVQWYGGPQQYTQYWPIQKSYFANFSYVTKQDNNTSIAERYWLSSAGLFVYFDLRTPLFISQNDGQNTLCFNTRLASPYRTDRTSYSFTETYVVGPDLRALQEFAVETFLKKPTMIPDERMISYPIWSTWARYKSFINEEIVLNFAKEILNYNFTNSQLEIDDLWEVCYGSLSFDTTRFPNIQGLVQQLHDMGFRVTLWIHPFINMGCDPWYTEASNNGYFVHDENNNTGTSWWNSNGTISGYVDFTNQEARKWFSSRLEQLQNETGIDSYKFDAGESSFTPENPILTGRIDLHPQLITQDYVREVSKFGPMVEVRSGQISQNLPIFVRMMDKESSWGFDNGLPTLVTTLLIFNIAGYTFVLPDMIGGNGYYTVPTKELFIRWLQANVFMPSLQYSYVPWDFDNETVEICRQFTQLHADYANVIMKQCQRSVDLGEPVNPPIWWIDPTDKIAQKCNDEFLLGDFILAAPVLSENQTSRSIYLPRGSWLDPNNGNKLIKGPKLILSYPAPLNVLPYFINTDSVLFA